MDIPRSRRVRLAPLLLVLLCLAPPPSHAAPLPLAIPGGTLRASQHGAATVLEITRHGRLARVTLPADDGIYARSLHGVGLVGALPGRALVLSLGYASRPGGALHMCGAGTETELDVIALRPTPHRTFHRRVASCWQSIEPGDPGIEWSRDGTLAIELTRSGDPAGHLHTHSRIGRDGTVAETATEYLP